MGRRVPVRALIFALALAVAVSAGVLIGYDAPGAADALASVASPRILQLLLQLDRADLGVPGDHGPRRVTRGLRV